METRPPELLPIRDEDVEREFANMLSAQAAKDFEKLRKIATLLATTFCTSLTKDQQDKITEIFLELDQYRKEEENDVRAVIVNLRPKLLKKIY